MAKPLIVVLIVDALGWEISSRYEFCHDLLERKAPLDTVLGYSSAAIPSLLSGKKPSEHGAWAMWRLADRATSTFGYLRFVPQLPHPLDWRVRRQVQKITDRRKSIAGYYNLYDIPVHLLSRFDVAQHQDPYLPGGLSCETIFDSLIATGVPHRTWYYKTSEADNMQELLQGVSGKCDVLFLYTPEMDALMHRTGIFAGEVEKKLRGYERFIGAVLERGKRADRDVKIYVVSDHGMTDVNNGFDIWGGMEGRGLKVGRDYLAFYDSTMARFWCDDRARKTVVDLLAAAGAGRELGDAELDEFGCLFEDRRYGRYVFLANPGTMFVPSFMGKEKIAAMHGYDPGDKYSKACFLTNDTSGVLPSSILDFKAYLMDRVREGQA